MLWRNNPYQSSLEALEQAIIACERAIASAEELPPSKGRSDVWDAAEGARQRLHEARASIQTWHEAFKYHAGRTDF
jgi:hypothetical protein